VINKQIKVLTKSVFHRKSILIIFDMLFLHIFVSVNGITFHKEVSREKARFLHSNGALHYIHGIGDRKELKGVKLNRNMKLKSFKIS